MKLYGQVTRISDLIDIPGKDWKEGNSKKILCVEEINEEADALDRIAIDFLWDKVALLDWLEIWSVVTVRFGIVYNAYEDKIYNSVRWRRISVSVWTPIPREDLPF